MSISQRDFERVRDRCIEFSRYAQTGSYKETAERLGLTFDNPPDRRKFNHILFLINVNEIYFDRPFLTACIVHKNGDHEPGEGFDKMSMTLQNKKAHPADVRRLCTLYWRQETNLQAYRDSVLSVEELETRAASMKPKLEPVD